MAVGTIVVNDLNSVSSVRVIPMILLCSILLYQSLCMFVLYKLQLLWIIEVL